MKHNTPHLEEIKYPDKAAVEEAYRILPRYGGIKVTSEMVLLDNTLKLLEGQGFCGMQVLGFSDASVGYVTVAAYKGKAGPCFEGGHSAMYHGAAMAVLDDDHHLLFSNKSLPVCIKTAGIYGLPSYRHVVAVSQQAPQTETKGPEKPKPFDCDDFDANVEELGRMLASVQPEVRRTTLFYPGPFRKLLLRDGSIVERGRLNSVPESLSSALIKKDLCLRASGQLQPDPVFFQRIDSGEGVALLLEHREDGAFVANEKERDFSVLRTLKPALRRRLRSMIESGKKYMVLTGSDPLEIHGCCPSSEVGEANRLVRSGILDAVRHPLPSDACPVTTYAFRGEISMHQDGMNVAIDEDLRHEVLQRLRIAFAGGARAILKWLLIGILVITSLLAIGRLTDLRLSGPPRVGDSQLAPEHPDQILVLLFHNQMRCDQCLHMERYIRSTIHDEWGGKIAGQPLSFKLVNINAPENRALVDRFGIYTATPVILDYAHGEIQHAKVLYDAWKMHQSEHDFKRMFEQEIEQLMGEGNE
jgi:hypothetical protein